MSRANEAKYSFKFVSDVYDLAREKHIKPRTCSIEERKNGRGYYDLERVTILVPRPDRKNQIEKTFDLKSEISKLEKELNTDDESEEEEV